MGREDRFRTVIEIPDLPKIDYTSNILLLGSCFVTSIGERLSNYLFRVEQNPYGIIYNTASIAYSLNRLLEGNPFTEDDLSQRGDLYFSWHHHGAFSGSDPAYVLRTINQRFIRASNFARNSDLLILTPGTSRIYRHNQLNSVVANCHKEPAQNFTMELLSPAKNEELLKKPIERFLTINPEARVILTVSPVRHRKDGLVENQLSKSSLIVAARALEKSSDRIHYFPAYEIMMDELRDYRFYESDMLHPGEVARDYIWERFAENSCDRETISIIKHIDTILARLSHRPFHPSSGEYSRFLDRTGELIDQVENSPNAPDVSPLRDKLDDLRNAIR